MRPRDLFIEAAQYARPDAYGVISSPERVRLDELERALRDRAANLLDNVFKAFGQNVSNPQSPDDRLRIPNVKDDTNGALWFGETKVYTVPDSFVDSRYEKEVTRRWVVLEIPAEEEFDQFAPEGFHVNKRILVGSHDLRHSSDKGTTWVASNRAASLEIITGLFIEPDNESQWSELEDDEVADPFDYGPVVLERMNFRYPVFFGDDDTATMIFGKIPTPHEYPNPHSLIEGIHSSLDEFEKALAA